LYGRLLGSPTTDIGNAGRNFRYGRSSMQIHYALREPLRWSDDRLNRTAVVHLTTGLDGVSRAVNEADRGLLPAEPTVVCGQPLAQDPSRAPAGAGLLWVQVLELPRLPRGDAADALRISHARWTTDLRERVADRVQGRLAAHASNLEAAILQRTVLSPADLATQNINLAFGDPYSGSTMPDQNLLFRPFAAGPGHRTPIPGLWQVGASTHPGPGLAGGSGLLVATQLLALHRRFRGRWRASRASSLSRGSE